MKLFPKLLSAGYYLTFILLSGTVPVFAQSDDRMSLKTAKTAVEKYHDYEQAERYLNRIHPSSPYRDSADFLQLHGTVYAALADKAQSPRPDYYLIAIADFEKLYAIKQDESVSERIADLKYKYDKARQQQQLTSGSNIDTAQKPLAKGYVPTARERKKFFSSAAYTVLHKPAWHLGIKVGLNFDYFHFAAQQYSRSEITVNNRVTETAFNEAPVYRPSPGMGAMFGLVCHPYISDHVAVGIHCDGVAGTTPLVFAGGGSTDETSSSKHSYNTTYIYGHFNYGMELTAGFAWLKFIAGYDHSLRHSRLSYSEEGYITSTMPAGVELIRQNAEHEVEMEFRHEEIMLGLRLFPYSKDKLRIRRPCLLDLAYTINRDYVFGWRNTPWSYRALNNFYHGAKLNLWVESTIGFSVSASFPSGYFTGKDEPVNTASTKALPFITASLFYNINFFGLGY